MKTRIPLACLLVLAIPLFSVPASFYLVYEVQGSEYPVRIRATLDSQGAYTKVLSLPAYGDSPARFETVSGRLPPQALAALVNELVEKRGFFRLPKTFRHEHMKMDMANEFLSVSLDGRYHRIGGYAAGSHPDSRGVFQLVGELEKQLVDRQVRKFP